LIEQENAKEYLLNADTMQLNVKGTINKTFSNSKALKNNMLEPIEIYEDRVSYAYCNFV